MARTKRLNLRFRPDESRQLKRIARAAREAPTAWARRAVLSAIQRVEQLAQNPAAKSPEAA